MTDWDWMTEPPKVNGWYWYDSGWISPCILRVVDGLVYGWDHQPVSVESLGPSRDSYGYWRFIDILDGNEMYSGATDELRARYAQHAESARLA